MSEAWFSMEAAPWFSMFALFALLSYLQPWVRKGLHQKWVLGAYRASVVLGLGLLTASVVAYVLQQPTWVWFTFLLSGGLLTGLMAWATWQVSKEYEAAELRKTIATDL